jgi:hypothetical protein
VSDSRLLTICKRFEIIVLVIFIQKKCEMHVARLPYNNTILSLCKLDQDRRPKNEVHINIKTHSDRARRSIYTKIGILGKHASDSSRVLDALIVTRGLNEPLRMHSHAIKSSSKHT